MIPTNTSAQKTIDALEFARDALVIDLNSIYQLMLENALKGEFSKNVVVGVQQELPLLHEAKQKIDEAIATLREYQQTSACS